MSYEKLADWPLGRRNRALAQALAYWFGADLQGWVVCSRCREKLEFQMNSRPLTEAPDPTPEGPVSVNGRLFRLPTSRDLACAVREPDPGLAAIRLLESCDLQGNSSEANCESLVEDLELTGEQMARADPLAEIRVTFHCSNCGHEWEETLDLGVFVWARIEMLAKRLLREVHVLASAYGWIENEILSLSEARRSFYLQMVEA
jgi:hypothetical protein